ncbi:MAG: site-2 protease family protein [Raoultibacter sp.]
MDVFLMILYGVIVLGFLVFIHEGGHYLAARAFGVRVTEFMLGLPGPGVGFTWKGTRFGVTAVPLGGYAKVCGMEPGPEQPYLEEVLACMYRRGTANMEDISAELGITDDEAYEALEQLSEWGSIVGPSKKDSFNTYRTPAVKPGAKARERGEVAYALGDPRPISDPHEFFLNERKQQYRSLPFWKRSVILLAGVITNLLFAVLVIVVLYSVIGRDVMVDGAMQHVTLDPLRAISMGFAYIGMVVQAVAGLFNPATFGDTVSNSTSIMGIAVASKEAADAGFMNLLEFSAMISVSLGIMNLIPIPPLDGGRFVIEIFQKISKKFVSMKVLGYMSAVGMLLFVGLFLVMINQDIQRFIFGNWG